MNKTTSSARIVSSLLLLTLGSILNVSAQTPPAETEPAVKIGSVKLESASLPGSSLSWIKVITTFSTTERWLDGVAFTVTALLGSGDQMRAVTGNVRYMNIPAGTHNAILYLSPRAVARFGQPVAVEVLAFHKDVEVATSSWKSPSASGSLPNWQSLNTYPNVLVNVTRTPWILIDYEKAPDVGAN